jgi:predicted ATPase
MIRKITVKNFKSLGDVTVDLEPTTVLIGRSGVGKSNLLRAIRFLRGYLVNPNAALAFEGGWGRIIPFGQPRPMMLSVTYALPGFEHDFRYTLQWDSLPHQQGQLHLRAEELLYGSDTLISNNSAHAQPVVSPMLGNQPTNTHAILSFAALTNGIGWHDFPANVLQNGASQDQVNAKGLNDSASNFLAVLRDLTQDLRDQSARRQIIARLKQMNDSVSSVELNSILDPRTVIVGHNLANATVPFDLSQESDGFRRYFAHLLAIYQTPPKQFLMFEEPENGVAPGILSNLSEEFNTAPNSGRGHVLLSTQSPDLLNGFTPEQIRVVEIDRATQMTKVGRLDPEQIEAVRDQLLSAGELLTVDPARRGAERAIAS